MNRSQLRRIWRNENKRNGVSWSEYLRRYQIAQRAKEALVNGPPET